MNEHHGFMSTMLIMCKARTGMFLLGCLAFALFFLGDINDWKLRRPALRHCFPLGFILLAVSTACASAGNAPQSPPALRLIFGALGLLSLLLMLYSLFWAIPAGASYMKAGEGREVCAAGVYALCRHPGVLFFIPLYLCLWLSTGLPLYMALGYSVLNLLLITLEDFRVFPALIRGYGAYKREVPFLIPTPASFRRCFATLRQNCKDVNE